MSRKIWRKLGLVAMSSGTVFGGLGCISLDGAFDLQRLLTFLVDTTIINAAGLGGGLAGLAGGILGGGA